MCQPASVVRLAGVINSTVRVHLLRSLCSHAAIQGHALQLPSQNIGNGMIQPQIACHEIIRGWLVIATEYQSGGVPAAV
jgi:hypothetical protein